MTVDQNFTLDSIAAHETPPSGRIAYVRNADGTFSPAQMTGGIAQPAGYMSNAGANQDATNVKLVPTTMFALAAQNTHATLMRYLKLYDKLNPTSADTPVARYALAPAGGGIARQMLAEKFVTALSFRITTGPLDADTGAASAGDVFVNLDCS